MAARTTDDETNLVPPWGLMARVLEADFRLLFLGLQIAMVPLYAAEAARSEGRRGRGGFDLDGSAARAVVAVG